ncbi:MFS transporter [Streptomyces sp. SLBN-118]|uniref:MFS transporter n=1 Tax=Streptomyces sp. SLBN-118 TaxID=2768454 RepID=UPI001174EEA3|nr:MFS transporter [Streptomyces sp. SLBN-118]TQK42351.1 MFS transporter [Streptomyces sp. SLBN-118]
MADIRLRTRGPTEQPPTRPTLAALLRASGGGRYTSALAVDALAAGLLRPFLLLYGISVMRLDPGTAGLALSIGMFAGLGAVPLTGRWIDHGARTAPVAATLLVRVAGTAVLLAATGPLGFTAAAVLLGIGNQCWPTAHAAMVAALADDRHRDAALAAGRSLRNAGLGVGALIATVAVTAGTGALRGAAVVTALGYLVAAALVWSMRVPVGSVGNERQDISDGDGGSGLGHVAVLGIANLAYAFCYDVLEVALPALLLTHLHASPSWSAGIFVGNTLMVVVTQVTVVLWLARRSRRMVLAGSGVVLAVSYLGFWAAGSLGGHAGTAALAAVAVLYTAGEILYTGSGTALVIATASPHLLGRALARWQLSTGIARSMAPAALTGLLEVGPGLLWGVLAGTTMLAAVAIRWGTPADHTPRGYGD